VILINIWAFSCLYMGLFVPALNGPCSCPPMGRDLGPNPARYNGPCRPGTKLFRAVPCLGRAFFSVLRAGPSGPAQMYTYTVGRTRATTRKWLVSINTTPTTSIQYTQASHSLTFNTRANTPSQDTFKASKHLQVS
jgi:hypothetical protein